MKDGEKAEAKKKADKSRIFFFSFWIARKGAKEIQDGAFQSRRSEPAV